MTPKPCWIETIDEESADPALKAAYDQVRGPGGKTYNLYRAFSLRPAPMVPADQHYRAVLHNPENALEKWILEMVATYVAIRADCTYARTHHGANFLSLLDDETRGPKMMAAMERDDFSREFDPREKAIMIYTQKLTATPHKMREEDLVPLREVGLNDVEILEVNQACAAFAYWVRHINGLGISLTGEPGVGLYGNEAEA
ncbi:MAG: alkylhydroperoxidase [Pseudomonadota bacterium]